MKVCFGRLTAVAIRASGKSAVALPTMASHIRHPSSISRKEAIIALKVSDSQKISCRMHSKRKIELAANCDLLIVTERSQAQGPKANLS